LDRDEFVVQEARTKESPTRRRAPSGRGRCVFKQMEGFPTNQAGFANLKKFYKLATRKSEKS
jgi:hypothetical protein